MSYQTYHLDPTWSVFAAELKQHYGLRLEDEHYEKFQKLYELLSEKNESMNLTRIVGFEAVLDRHYLDSLTVLEHLPPSEPFMLADVGAGAGFPSLPIAIVRPNAQVMAIEATQKKADYIQEAAHALGLTNVTVNAKRVEEVGLDPKCREKFDVVVARAVGPCAVLAEYALPLLKVGGVCLLYKTEVGLKNEMEEAKSAYETLGAQEAIVYEVPITSLSSHRIVALRKTSRTPPQYPRRVGVPNKKPL